VECVGNSIGFVARASRRAASIVVSTFGRRWYAPYKNAVSGTRPVDTNVDAARLEARATYNIMIIPCDALH